MDGEAELLAEVERVLNDAGELEQLAELVRLHASVARLLAALEARINEVAAGRASWP